MRGIGVNPMPLTVITLFKISEKAAGIFQISGVRMTFCKAANQSKRAERVVPPAAKLPQDRAIFFSGDFCKGFAAGAPEAAIGVYKKHRLSVGQLLTCKLRHSPVKSKGINTQGKPDAVIIF